MPRRSRAVAAIAATSLALAGCAGSVTTVTAPPEPSAVPGSPLDLRGACPDRVVFQQDWQPEAEYGALYALVGGNRSIDAGAKNVSGPLIAQGLDTGVDVEVRPATGSQPAAAAMAADPAITMATVASDDVLAATTQYPVVTVFAPINTSPQMIMWDPAKHPGATTIAQAAAGGAPVVTSGDTIPSLLIEQGIIRPEQRDTSYEGTPARFVANSEILQQGFATTEPHTYQNEIPQWGRPVAFQRLAEVGYSVYPQSLVVDTKRLDSLRPCMDKLVPILQRAQLDYLASPGPTNALMVDLVGQYQAGWTYSAATAAYASRELVEGGYVRNDPASGVFGQMDPRRWRTIVDTFGPPLQAEGSLPAGPLPAPGQFFNNEFLDPTIRAVEPPRGGASPPPAVGG